MFKKILVVLITGVCVLVFSNMSYAAGCGHSSASHHTAQAAEGASKAAESEMKTEAVNVGNEICPVTGEKVDGKTTYEYQGKIYNFCCPACIDEFKKNPEKYIKKVEEELKSEPKEATEKQIMPPSTGAGEHSGHEH